MKKLWMIVPLALLALATWGADSRQPAPAPKAAGARVVVVVDMGHIFKDSKFAKQIQEEFKTWEDNIKAEVQPKLDLLKQKQEALKDPEGKLTPQQKEDLNKELAALQNDLMQRQRQAQQEFKQKQEDAGRRLQEKVDPILQKLADENGWDVILNKGQDALWVRDAADVTDMVMSRLDAETPDAPAPAAAPKTDKKP
jgi:Skp family chaperone for outer membrane proteins